MSIQLQAVIIGRGWNERKMWADKKEEMKTRKNGQQQVEFRGVECCEKVEEGGIVFGLHRGAQ
jgi:hypothetical protein